MGLSEKRVPHSIYWLIHPVPLKIASPWAGGQSPGFHTQISGYGGETYPLISH